MQIYKRGTKNGVTSFDIFKSLQKSHDEERCEEQFLIRIQGLAQI